MILPYWYKAQSFWWKSCGVGSINGGGENEDKKII